MNSGVRVSIPNNVRKTIQNIKEITGNHSEDEIYAMLKDCSMDPNETAQKLLLQDPFHEVRSKRYRKKENPTKESTEPRWKPGMQGRGNRGGRGNYSSRHISHDAGSSRNAVFGKENEINQGADDGVIMPAPQDKKNKETFVVGSSSNVVADRSADIAAEKTSSVPETHLSAVSDINQSELNAAAVSSNLEGPLPQAPPEAKKIPTAALGDGSSRNISASKAPSPLPGVYLSASDPILMPSQDSRLPVGTIRREVGSQRTPVEQVQETPVEINIASNTEVGSSFMQGKMHSEIQEEGNNLLSESSRPAPSIHVSSSIGRPPSNYNNRQQQAIGPQKVGPGKEWKPKPTNAIPAQGPVTCDSMEVPTIPVEGLSSLKPASSILDSKDVSPEKERKLEESRISDGQLVIIPNHLHVPEAEKLGFCFGSFDASFGFNSSSLSGNDKTPSLSEAPEGITDHVEEQASRTQDVLVTPDDGDYPDCPPSSSNVPENLSAEGEVSSSVAPDHIESNPETSLPTTGHQYPVVHASPNLSFGFMPPIIGSHLAPFENNESQVRDASRVPSFVVQQPFDPAGYYPHFYRSGADSDGRVSPFHSSGVATKYNGNVAVLSPQASQSSQEVGNSITLSAAGPTPLATQAAGVMQSSLAVTQQPLPVFRQPAGLHLPHYPPNYIPYGPYFSPFYIPPPSIHQFLSNGAFPQQPQAGNMYPAPPVATPKYPLPQYKPGSNTGNSGHIGVPGTYGPYGTSPAGYNPNPAATAGNSTSNEDLGGSQFKESNVYVTGQQSEGPGVWIAGRGDIGGSFYNLPQGGQVAYTPTQAGHGTFASIYHHPPQPVTTGAVHPLLQQSHTGGDMVGPTSSMYQQQQQQPPHPHPQPAQINWPNNY
ncbi:hypothetical protein L6452_28421 [Arctium lappa]|uniref:Uncharacterized protein n=1 Tax=Arctium lappa TaxID=4217 RepID=A0ACB8ZYM9_ARCLA|nr:hypothetical protein L6452_28421 [Arctium lappa]